MRLSTRRTFLRQSALTAGVVAAGSTWMPRSAAAADVKLFSTMGACTSIGNAAKVKAAGGGHIEGGVQSHLIPQKPDAAWQPKLEQIKKACLPMPACNGFIPGSLRSTGRDANHEGVLAYTEIAFKRARQAGVEIIVFGSSGSRKLPKGFPRDKGIAQFTELLKKMGPQAARYGVTVAIEPLNTKEDNLICPITDGAMVAEAVGHPNVKIIADIYHMMRNGETPENIRKCRGWIVHCHIAENEGRTAPGVHGEDFRPYFKALSDIGFNGRISIEGRWKTEQLPKAYDVMRKQVAEALA